ncbi:MAG: VWA domain-containing protein [Candidatus Aenigmarchaeota archaeon]|nr:VWA domain-containing protein [Candidatus Aenigmarchaeota archaeon]
MPRKKEVGKIKDLLPLIVILGLTVFTISYFQRNPVKPPYIEKVDDWQYTPTSDGIGNYSPLGIHQKITGVAAPESDLGFAAGGAKDINNFRDNIENNYLPIPTDLPYEGLFYDYYFDTGQAKQCNELFCPSYSKAVTRDPLSAETEYYMTVGLNSNLKKEDFERKKLNLILVLDVSGSMSSGFSEYYYDRFGNKHRVEEPSGKSKMEAASESLAALTEHLEEGDRLGIVLFNNQAYKAKPMRLVEETDMSAIRNHILEIEAGGGTNMAAGMDMATQMLQEYKNADKSKYENRIIFMTDMMPNIGVRSESGLLGKMKDNADDGIYTSFVGIGVDFNTELVEAITKVDGTNYFSVHSSKQFSERMDDDFEYMVTPLVFDLTLELDSDSYRIKKVYGSTAADEATGEIMKVNTLFPSRKQDGETKGGIVLLQLEKIGDDSDLDLTVTYETREGEVRTSSSSVEFEIRESEYFENLGIRKAVLLTRYADLMKNWIIYERSQIPDSDVPIDAVRTAEMEGIEPPWIFPGLGRWERQSKPLTISELYIEKIQLFKEHFEQEMDTIDDNTLEQEVDIMEKLAGY